MGDVGELRIERQAGPFSTLLWTDVARRHALREKRRRQALQY
jgi:hypothetical protein